MRFPVMTGLPPSVRKASPLPCQAIVLPAMDRRSHDAFPPESATKMRDFGLIAKSAMGPSLNQGPHEIGDPADPKEPIQVAR